MMQRRLQHKKKTLNGKMYRMLMTLSVRPILQIFSVKKMYLIYFLYHTFQLFLYLTSCSFLLSLSTCCCHLEKNICCITTQLVERENQVGRPMLAVGLVWFSCHTTTHSTQKKSFTTRNQMTMMDILEPELNRTQQTDKVTKKLKSIHSALTLPGFIPTIQ